MKLLIQFKDNGEKTVRTFGILEEDKSGADQPNDDEIFFWLTPEEATAIGEDYDGGDWVVLRCACDECEEYEIENAGYQLSQGRE